MTRHSENVLADLRFFDFCTGSNDLGLNRIIQCSPYNGAIGHCPPLCYAALEMGPSHEHAKGESVRRTVVVVDLARFSEISQSLQDGHGFGPTGSELISRQIAEMIRRALSSVNCDYDQTYVKGTGDGAILQFETEHDAEGFAVALHKLADEHNKKTSRDLERRSFRIGVVSGNVLLPDGDIAGTAVTYATRLQARAKTGEIMIDRASWERLVPDSRKEYGPDVLIRVKDHDTPITARSRMVVRAAPWEVAGSSQTGFRFMGIRYNDADIYQTDWDLGADIDEVAMVHLNGGVFRDQRINWWQKLNRALPSGFTRWSNVPAGESEDQLRARTNLEVDSVDTEPWPPGLRKISVAIANENWMKEWKSANHSKMETQKAAEVFWKKYLMKLRNARPGLEVALYRIDNPGFYAHLITYAGRNSGRIIGCNTFAARDSTEAFEVRWNNSVTPAAFKTIRDAVAYLEEYAQTSDNIIYAAG